MSGVRPTKRCLDDLELGFPSITTPLTSVDHPLVSKAQTVPRQVTSGGTERVLALSDRFWCKVKVGNYRGIAGELQHDPASGLPEHQWWLVAAGHRQADSPKHDFYDQITQECQRAARGMPNNVSSDALLPATIDAKRYIAEQAALLVDSIRQIVRDCLRRSTHTGEASVAETDGHRIVGLVKSTDGESYVAVAAEGFIRPDLIAIILDAVPGLSADDWIPEPGEVLGIQPISGQIIYSAMLPASAQAELLEEGEPEPRD